MLIVVNTNYNSRVAYKYIIMTLSDAIDERDLPWLSFPLHRV